MKHKALIAVSIIFFLIVNTIDFWIVEVGFLIIPISLLLIGAYFVLVGLVTYQLFLLFQERFANRSRLVVVILMITVLTLTMLAPTGIIDSEGLEGEDLLVAQREGAANCMTMFRLKENGQFIESGFCFRASEIKGTYKRIGDTLFFTNVELSRDEQEYYQYAIIKRSENSEYKLGDLIRYKNKSDTTGQELWIVKNNLSKGMDGK